MSSNLLDGNGQGLLNGLAENWEPQEIRSLAVTLLRLADSIDQNWNGPEPKSIFRWPNSLSRIERNAVNLAMKARLIYDNRRLRKDHVPSEFLGEPGWDMLLELFMQFAGGAKVSTNSLCIASDCPATTALRYVSQMESAGLVTRSTSAFDKRVTFIELTERGVVAVGRYLEEVQS